MDRRQVLAAIAIGATSVRELFAGTFGTNSAQQGGGGDVVLLRPGEKYKLPSHPPDGMTLNFRPSEAASFRSSIVPAQGQMIMGERDPLEVDTQTHFNLRYEKVSRCWMFYIS